jgi:hypothetical protein
MPGDPSAARSFSVTLLFIDPVENNLIIDNVYIKFVKYNLKVSYRHHVRNSLYNISCLSMFTIYFLTKQTNSGASVRQRTIQTNFADKRRSLGRYFLTKFHNFSNVSLAISIESKVKTKLPLCLINYASL